MSNLIEHANSLARELQGVLAQAFGPKVQFHFIVGTESFSLTVGDKNEIKWSRSHPSDPGIGQGIRYSSRRSGPR